MKSWNEVRKKMTESELFFEFFVEFFDEFCQNKNVRKEGAPKKRKKKLEQRVLSDLRRERKYGDCQNCRKC